MTTTNSRATRTAAGGQHPHHPHTTTTKMVRHPSSGLPVRPRRLAVLLAIVGIAWLLIVWRQHRLVVTIDNSNNTQPKPSPLLSTSTSSSLLNKKTIEIAQQRHHESLFNTHAADESDKIKQEQKVLQPQQPLQEITTNHRVGVVVDATFNTIPLELKTNNHNNKLRSYVECIRHHRHYDLVGNNKNNNSWMFTSCQFTNLCFDVETHEYVLVVDDNDVDENDNDELQRAQAEGLALGGVNPRWDFSRGFDKGSYKVRWFPSLVKSSSVQSYYALPLDYVWIPFHSMGGHNVGHMLWDDFYPIFRLAQLFGFVDTTAKNDDVEQRRRWLLTRHVVNETLYASCDIRRNKRVQCMNNFVKFLELLNVDPMTFTSNRRVQFQVSGDESSPPQQQQQHKSNLVCARTGLAGIGMLTDHGLRDHGWERRESWIPHNLGHGRTFYDFRSFVLGNIQEKYNLKRFLQPSTGTGSKKEPLQITFSLLSSRDFDRRLDFGKQIRALLEAQLSHDNNNNANGDQAPVLIRSYALWNMTVAEQLQVTLQSHIWISAVGGASMTSTFLQRHASLILFYNETGGLDFSQMQSNGKPARLDWDLLNNSHLRVHWLPIGGMDTEQQLKVFVRLIQHELAVIRNL